MLLDTVEESAFVLADNLLKTDIVRENTDNIRKWPLLHRRTGDPWTAEERKKKNFCGSVGIMSDFYFSGVKWFSFFYN